MALRFPYTKNTLHVTPHPLSQGKELANLLKALAVLSAPDIKKAPHTAKEEERSGSAEVFQPVPEPIEFIATLRGREVSPPIGGLFRPLYRPLALIFTARIFIDRDQK